MHKGLDYVLCVDKNVLVKTQKLVLFPFTASEKSCTQKPSVIELMKKVGSRSTKMLIPFLRMFVLFLNRIYV